MTRPLPPDARAPLEIPLDPANRHRIDIPIRDDMDVTRIERPAQ